MTYFTEKNFPNDLFSSFTHNEYQLFISATGQTITTAHVAFRHCTFQVVTARFVHYCTLKQAWYSHHRGFR